MEQSLIEKKNGNFAKPVLSAVDEFPIIPTVEFTEDCWNTVHRGCCIDSTFDAYLVRGYGYGSFWIPKCYVRLVNC
jgi:hypothetical protein